MNRHEKNVVGLFWIGMCHSQIRPKRFWIARFRPWIIEQLPILRCIHSYCRLRPSTVQGDHIDRCECAPVLCVFKGIATDEHDIQHDATRPHVNTRAIVDALREHLRSKIGRCAHSRLAQGLVPWFGIPKVADFYERSRSRAPQQRVFELHVAVSHPLRMQVLDATDELLEKVARVVFGESLCFLDEREQLPTCTRVTSTSFLNHQQLPRFQNEIKNFVGYFDPINSIFYHIT